MKVYVSYSKGTPRSHIQIHMLRGADVLTPGGWKSSHSTGVVQRKTFSEIAVANQKIFSTRF